MIQRRGAYSNHKLPTSLKTNGFVEDLITEVTNAAKTMQQTPHIFRKNKDYYIAVLIPRLEEIQEG